MFTASPFPGMDPYIEPVWGPFHAKYVNHLQEQLAGQLPDGLYAGVEADVYVVDRDVRGRRFQPDVGTFDPADRSTAEAVGPTAAAVADSVRVRVRRPTVPVWHVAIRQPAGSTGS